MGTRDLLGKMPASDDSRMSHESSFSGSTASLVLENIDLNRVKDRGSQRRSKPLPPVPRSNNTPYSDYADNLSDFDDDDPLKEGNDDLETGPFLRQGAVNVAPAGKRMDRSTKRAIIAVSVAVITVWVVGLFVYLSAKSYKNPSDVAHDPQATVSRGHGKPISLDELSQYVWSPTYKSIEWIAGSEGEDGLVLTTESTGKHYLTVQDVRSQDPQYAAGQTVVESKTLMNSQTFHSKGETVYAESAVPSKNLLKVLVASDRTKVWRHSSTHRYWLYDVATQSGEPLIPNEPDAHIQIALWSPTNDAIVFVRGNNLYLRSVSDQKVTQITKDGGQNIFNGIPDWVYEEEVFNADRATWWSDDGKYIAFLRTNETEVVDFNIQYYVSNPSGNKVEPGKESYPDTVPIKYPKAGSPNPVVDLQFYDVEKGDVFSVDISGGFADDDRLITNVIWMGKDVLIKESNRVSDVMRVVLVDVGSRTGKTVRNVDLNKLDGGWFEISKKTTYIPADPKNGRQNDGYVDQVVTDGYDHLAYFTPLDSDKPILLTKGEWEVVDAPEAVDLARNLVYFVATKDGSIQRHVYSVKLDGTGIAPITDTSKDGYYGVSFSTGGGYALLSYQGPDMPYQKVISTPANEDKFEHIIQENKELEKKARQHEMPILKYGTIEVDGVELNYLERRPPHFNENKKYPVLFFQYSGPGSQEVTKRFAVDFQSYVASALGYVVVTVDGRGTGFLGRKNRVLIRGKLGHWEAKDQIAAGKHWASLPYIDASKIAIWGWSYGGFQTLKTLEMDAGKTFSYGMAVAPVTDWRFYDSMYTERYMRTPETNPEGYAQSAIANATALGQNVRFLMMHGTGDDNVHFQNSLKLLDKLDVANVVNYDVHVFPDSDHGIYLHNARAIVNQKLSDWIVNAFNGEWLKTAHPKPINNRNAKRSP